MKKQVISNWISKRYFLSSLLFALFFLPFQGSAQSSDHGHGTGQTTESHGVTGGHGHASGIDHELYKDEEEDIAKIIIHHVMDSHDWHLFDWPNGDGTYTPISLPLPWILYSSEGGFAFAFTTEALNDNYPNYVADAHGHVHYVAHKELVTSLSKAEFEANPEHYAVSGHGHHKQFWHIEHAAEEVSVMDFSITKTVLHMLLIALLMLWMFTKVAKAYKRRDGQAPKGLQSFMEPVILFVRNDVGRPFLGDKTERFLPYLLTLFFFLWFSNLLGLTPLSSNIAGNTSITVALALLTFILIIANSTKDFWLHIFWFPGVPLPLKPLMFVVEFMGLLTKPVALAIRLFANISAGHFMVLALVCLIFILGKGENPGEVNMAGALGISPMSVLFSLFIFAVELIVAAVQAFVFTLLTTVFISQAMESHSHDDHHGEHAGAHH